MATNDMNSLYERRKIQREELMALNKEALIEKIMTDVNELISDNNRLREKNASLYKELIKYEELMKAKDVTAAVIDTESETVGAISDNASVSWIEKIILVLLNQKKPLLLREIENLLSNENFKSFRMLNNPSQFISVVLSRGVNSHMLNRIHITGLKGYLYGLPEWFDDGNLKKKYLDMRFRFKR